MVTIKEAGYKFIKYLYKGSAVFQDLETGIKEVWMANIRHASYGFRFNNTDWEFCRKYKEND